MHKALREVLGPHVQQKGSQVDPDKTRFDFAHTQPVTAAEIVRIERIVNDEIIANAATEARVMPIDEAQKTGAMMLFGEKYGDEVRVLDIGSSCELCGGTHVARTGDIGLFKMVMEAGVAAGVRRIEAVCGDVAVALVQQQQALLDAVAAAFKAPAGGSRQARSPDARQCPYAGEGTGPPQGQAGLGAGRRPGQSGGRSQGRIRVLAAAMEGADAAACARRWTSSRTS
jgi:alanyl-tRNA synthetase